MGYFLPISASVVALKRIFLQRLPCKIQYFRLRETTVIISVTVLPFP